MAGFAGRLGGGDSGGAVVSGFAVCLGLFCAPRLRDVKRKVPVSMRLDPDVLEWLRGKGEGHLTRIGY